jgi:hypothetical protein
MRESELVCRVETLERRVQNMRRATIGAAGVAALLVLVAAGPGIRSALVADKVTTRQLEIVNDAGDVVATLDATDTGGRLRLVDENGAVAVALGRDNAGSKVIHVPDRAAAGWNILDRSSPPRVERRDARATDDADEPGEIIAAGGSLLRPGITATEAQRREAAAIRAAGWVYVMPRPKSPTAAWGNDDRRSTWWDGYWTNAQSGRTSKTVPVAGTGFAGDGEEGETWSRGAPRLPTVIEWLCSTEGGPEDRKP